MLVCYGYSMRDEFNQDLTLALLEADDSLNIAGFFCRVFRPEHHEDIQRNLSGLFGTSAYSTSPLELRRLNQDIPEYP